MADHDDPDALLVAYADGELDDAAAEAVEARLATDAEARRLVAIHRETAAMLRAAFPESRFAGGALPVAPPPVAAPRPRPRAAWQGGWRAAAAAVLLGSVGYGAGVAWPIAPGGGYAGMLEEIAEYHGIYARETVHLVEADASRADHIRAWLGARVERRITIPDLSAAGLTFAGARLVAVDGKAAAALMYTRADGLPIAVCVIRGNGPASPALAQHDGVSVAAWSDGTHTYVIVGEAPERRIRDLIPAVQQQI